jgi:regulator of RNase E activity RraA
VTGDISSEIIQRYRQVPAAVVASVLHQKGYRSVAPDSLGALVPDTRMVGTAVTLRCAPAREDVSIPSVVTAPDYPQRAAIEACGPDQVLVVDGRGITSAAVGGEIYLSRLERRGAAGYVVDGSVRDADGLRELGLPVFSRSTSSAPHHAKHIAVDWDVPIGIGEVLVLPGDLVVGDDDGLTVVPRGLAIEVLETAERTLALETFVLGRIRDGAPLDGTFPPDEATRAAFNAASSR